MLLEQNDYYPYGLRHSNATLVTSANPYLYGGKELQDAFGVDYYDSRARFQGTDGIFLSIDPLAEKFCSLSPYAYCGGNPVNYVDPDGKEMRVDKKYQEQFIRDLQNVFGDMANEFSFDDNGTLRLDIESKKFLEGMTRYQKKVFRGLNKAMRDKKVTSVVYENTYDITKGEKKQNSDIVPEWGGGLYSVEDNLIVISPNVGSTKVFLTPQEARNNKDKSWWYVVEQTTTTALFHEIGERNLGVATYRGEVVDFENNVRRIIGLPARPYDIRHQPKPESKPINSINENENKNYY